MLMLEGSPILKIINLFHVSVMVLESEEEEEKTRLLSESVTSSPTKQSDVLEKSNGLKTQRRGSQNQVRPSFDFDSELVPRFGWERRKSQGQHLLLGQAEKTFFAMSGVLETSSTRASKERSPGCDNNCDTIVQVPDSIQVVKNILSELEAANDNISDIDDDNEDTVDDCSECTCDGQLVNLSKYPGTRGSAVVDVHHEGRVAEVENRCSKHTTERFPRCYSESHRQRSRLRADRELVNLDKIETVGEDRLRHFSESTLRVNKRKRAASFSSELKQLRKNLISVKSQNRQEKDGEVESPAKCK